MSHGYVPVQWNSDKKKYDVVLWIGIVFYIACYTLFNTLLVASDEVISLPIVLIRALGTCAFIMLNIIISIGPLARINSKFLPLVYNRRHFGVSMFVIAFFHGVIVVFWYHGFGVISPAESLFFSNSNYTSLSQFPFETLGIFALCIFLFMAATSHDYWNANLGGPLWKAIHMGVYFAYALIVSHIALGAMQSPSTGILPEMALMSVVWVSSLHLFTAYKEIYNQRNHKHSSWVKVGRWQDIENNRAIVVSVSHDERVAIFRYEGNKLAAVSNVCQHQNGPLGEGKVIDGCITCPWHGFQYLPENGASPAPFTEKISTYKLKLVGDEVYLDPYPHPPGTKRPITIIEQVSNG